MRLKQIRKRCNCKSDTGFKYYGAKGIKCLIPAQDFIAWYKATKPEVHMHIGRIDHSKNYTLDNIEWQTNRDNAIERNNRCGLPVSDPRKSICVVIGSKEHSFDSQKEAAKFLGVPRAEITLMLQNKYKKSKHYSVRRI